MNMEGILTGLIESYKAMQTDYHNVGFIQPDIWGNSCRALDAAEKNLPEMMRIIRAGENIEDWQKHQGRADQ